MSGRREVADRVKRERGERLRAQRLSVRSPHGRPLNQADLGERVGLTAQQVSKYEGGKDLVSAGWAYRFSQALGCPFQAIYVGGRYELAETQSVFHREAHGFDDLPDLAPLAVERLTAERRRALKDVILELLEDEEAGAASPRLASVAGVRGIL